jgi:hypothetical protein
VLNGLTSALVVALLLGRAAAALAQAEAPDPNAVEPAAAKLAAEFNDPLTTVPQIFLQDAYGPESYGTEAQTNRLNIRLIVLRIGRRKHS